MARFIEGVSRDQATLFPERLDEWIGEDHLARVVDLFVDQLDLPALGFQQRYLNEIVWRWNHREPVWEVFKQWTTKSGALRMKTTVIWRPIPVVDQMRVLLQGAVGKQIRRSKEYGLCWP